MKKLNKKGFTIVELVIVIAVIGILSAVLIPTFSNLTEKANESAALQAVNNEYKAWQVEHAGNGETLKESLFVVYGENAAIKYVFHFDGSKLNNESLDITSVTTYSGSGAQTENPGYTYNNEDYTVFKDVPTEKNGVANVKIYSVQTN